MLPVVILCAVIVFLSDLVTNTHVQKLFAKTIETETDMYEVKCAN